MTPAAKRSRCAWLGSLPGTEMFKALLESVQDVSERLVMCLAEARARASGRASRDDILMVARV